MYDRDKKAEMGEQLAALNSALDRLADVVAKDDTSKSILDVLKEKGGTGKEYKDVPLAAEDRANELHPVTRQKKRGIADVDTPLNYSTMNRLNNVFKALTGDLGAFQKTIMNSVVWGNKAAGLSRGLAQVTPDMLNTSPIKNYKQAEKAFLDKAIAEKGLVEGYRSLGDRLAPSGEDLLKFLQAGFDPKDAGKVLTQRKKDELLKEMQEATRPRSPVPSSGPGARGAAAIAGGVDVAMLARVAATTALIAAPMVAGKLIQAGALHQIETNRPFAMLNPQLATNYALYDQEKLLSGMRYAKGISSSMANLFRSETEFQKTLEPFKVLGTKTTNAFLTGSLDIINSVTKPVSNFAKKLANGKNPEEYQAVLEEMSFWGLAGAGLGAVGGWFVGGPMGAIRGAAAGYAGGAAIGGAGELIGHKREEELRKMLNEESKHKGMLDLFSLQLEAKGVGPAREFVP